MFCAAKTFAMESFCHGNCARSPAGHVRDRPRQAETRSRLRSARADESPALRQQGHAPPSHPGNRPNAVRWSSATRETPPSRMPWPQRLELGRRVIIPGVQRGDLVLAVPGELQLEPAILSDRVVGWLHRSSPGRALSRREGRHRPRCRIARRSTGIGTSASGRRGPEGPRPSAQPKAEISVTADRRSTVWVLSIAAT
jgi:hypothetical protein